MDVVKVVCILRELMYVTTVRNLDPEDLVHPVCHAILLGFVRHLDQGGSYESKTMVLLCSVLRIPVWTELARNTAAEVFVLQHLHAAKYFVTIEAVVLVVAVGEKVAAVDLFHDVQRSCDVSFLLNREASEKCARSQRGSLMESRKSTSYPARVIDLECPHADARHDAFESEFEAS